jgi:predicted ribosomally synthesized peptide with SipW-like signal peptide
MTKINKIGKSSFVIAILSFLLVGVLAFGGTYAYFTAKTNDVTGSVQTGNLNIGNILVGEDDATSTVKVNGGVVVPNEVVTESVFSANVTSNIDYFVRVYFAVEFDLDETHEHAKGTSCADVVANAIDALKLTIAGHNAEDNEASTKWVRGALAGDTTAQKSKTEAYYYQLAPVDVATKLKQNNEAAGEGAELNVPYTTKVEFDVKIQVADFLGRAVVGDAQRCDYWMDAEITVDIRFEVMQADCIQDAGLDGAGAFTTVANAETAWTNALKAKSPEVA